MCLIFQICRKKVSCLIDQMPNITINEHGVNALLNSIDPKKSGEPDDLSGRSLLKHLLI